MVDIGTKSEAKISYAEATLIGDLRFSNKRMDDILTIGEEYEFEATSSVFSSRKVNEIHEGCCFRQLIDRLCSLNDQS